MNDQDTFRKEIRDALAHLYDTAHLESHPLVNLLIEPNISNRLTRAQMLRGLLKESIEALKPQPGTPSSSPDWRSYRALHSYYVKGMSFLEVQQDELGISRRQLQRELRKGLDALVAMLWERRLTEPKAALAETAVSPSTEESDLLRQELTRWEVNRQVCTLPSLIDDTQWMLRPFIEQNEATLTVDLLPTINAVYVDPTLTRQTLFRILRTLIRQSAKQPISVNAQEQSQTIDILICCGSPTINESAEDWEIANLLAAHQGHHLSQSISNNKLKLTLKLPLASRAKVLVVDDSEAIHRLYERYLAPHNYEIIGVNNGHDAIRFATEQLPDMIVLDLMMPTMDGWQVLRDLQKHETTQPIPIIICSVMDEKETALSLGAQAFVKKPVVRLEFIETLEQIRQTLASEVALYSELPAS